MTAELSVGAELSTKAFWAQPSSRPCSRVR